MPRLSYTAILALIVSAAVTMSLCATTFAQTDEDTLQFNATVARWAAVTLDEEEIILQSITQDPYDLEGVTGLSVWANFAYTINVHWLDDDYWDRETLFELDGLSWVAEPGTQQGSLRLKIDEDAAADPVRTGNATGSEAAGSVSVTDEGVKKGTVQVTVQGQ